MFSIIYYNDDLKTKEDKYMNQYENRGYYEKATTYKKMLSKLKSTTTNDDTVKSLLKKIMLNTVGEHVRVTMGGDATEHVLRYV